MITFLYSVLQYFLSLLFGRKAKSVDEIGKDGYKCIIVDTETPGIAKLIFNRPRKKNAFSKVMYTEITHALNKLSTDETVKVCMITGSGDFYSSGNDLSNFSASIMHPLTMAKLGRDMCDLFVSAFINFQKPLINVVNGPAIGIAATTLGLCDRVFASDKAYFKTPFAELAQSPEGCSSLVFPRIMGEEMAHEVLWKSKQLSAQEAMDIKFVYAVSSAGTTEANALAYCHELIEQQPNQKESQRWVVRENMAAKLHEVNQKELDVLQRKWVSSECFDALAAFLDKKNMKMGALALRIANFTGPLWGQPSGC
mmetsp:Transcript_24491/g.40832  ORF Transcript_24491/g.40832 Transcript_24491/m.40832 type:complete len:311 (+) Transcript_24491:50-982(+)|eukprot:CAMPEP_0174986414 /NCGR_PEP_ID=MMETSP0004_2-20121128/18938_1 /TAXON_ID=420556 /ORGANISM="Ochromonas sp., Strain CCMP1393" /LENGTH=310 /DNA_ID=CAMNT_0016239279 /DNA_START=26 /DNA_END=958 /DNA_ORIENTATION=-